MSLKSIILLALTIASFLLLAFIVFQQKVREEPQPEHNPYKDADLTIEIISTPNDTYGYNILINRRILIHQPSVPALPGIEGFETEEDARKVGEFVIEKIRQNIFPPSITVDELDSFGIH